MSTDALVQSPSSGYVYTSTFVSETSTSSTDSTSTGASSHVTVSAPSTKSAPAIVLACNSIAIIACALVLVAYVRLYREHRLLMRRTSLTLSCAMAASELLLHVSPSAWYGNVYIVCIPLVAPAAGSLRYCDGARYAPAHCFRSSISDHRPKVCKCHNHRCYSCFCSNVSV